MYIISRGVLALQYLLLYFYARWKSYPAQNQFLFQIAAILFSGGMWVGSYFLESEDANGAMRIAKFGLWYGGLAIEMSSNIVIWCFCRITGFRRTHLSERFATLTLLILGEGVISYALALQGSNFPKGYFSSLLVVGGVGFGPQSGLAIVMMCLSIYFLWVYYFSTFIDNAEYDVLHAYAWVISIILSAHIRRTSIIHSTLHSSLFYKHAHHL